MNLIYIKKINCIAIFGGIQMVALEQKTMDDNLNEAHIHEIYEGFNALLKLLYEQKYENLKICVDIVRRAFEDQIFEEIKRSNVF